MTLLEMVDRWLGWVSVGLATVGLAGVLAGRYLRAFKD